MICRCFMVILRNGLGLRKMSSKGETFYAVGVGRVPGVYKTWAECKSQVDGVKYTKYRKFYSLAEAEDFVKEWTTKSKSKSNYVPKDECRVNKASSFNDDKSSRPCDSSHNDHCESHPKGIVSPKPNSSGKSQAVDELLLASDDDDEKGVERVQKKLKGFEGVIDLCMDQIVGVVTILNGLKRQLKRLSSSLNRSPDEALMGCPIAKRNLCGGTLPSAQRDAAPTLRKRKAISDSEEGESESEVDEAKRQRLLSAGETSREHEGPETCIDLESDGPGFTTDEDGYVVVFTDGACHFNGRKGARAGIGVWFGNDHPLNVGRPLDGPATNNNAEIQAARVAIETALKSGIKKLKIKTDSAFLMNCATEWMPRWKKRNWLTSDNRPVKNRKELELLDEVMSKISLRWEKVPAHTGVKGNEMADELANKGAAKYVAESSEQE